MRGRLNAVTGLLSRKDSMDTTSNYGLLWTGTLLNCPSAPIKYWQHIVGRPNSIQFNHNGEKHNKSKHPLFPQLYTFSEMMKQLFFVFWT